ncbi:unnamed protein product, partial [marine sediment metagenome]
MADKPVILMPEDIQRIIGKDAQRNNILAAKMVSDVVKTTLGPKGMDKMLVSPTNEIIVTNDGVTILDEMQIEHPAAKMMVEVAKTQEDEVGDGTTTAVMIAGKLLENAEKLLDMKIHPTVITKGYRIAAEKAQEILKDIEIEWTGTRKLTDYFKFELQAKFRILALSNVEIDQNGVKVSTNKGSVEIKVKGIIVKDYEGKFERTGFRKFLRSV